MNLVNRGAIRSELRTRAPEPPLRRRRAIAILAVVGLADAAVVSLYQLGILRRLPDPPAFASDEVAGSRDAYAFGVPDGALAAAQLSGVLVFSAAGGAPRGGRAPILDLLLGAVSLAGAAIGSSKSARAVREGRLCAWCLPLLAIQLGILALAAPGALSALNRLR